MLSILPGAILPIMTALPTASAGSLFAFWLYSHSLCLSGKLFKLAQESH
jgi:hypothetical protein